MRLPTFLWTISYPELGSYCQLYCKLCVQSYDFFSKYRQLAILNKVNTPIFTSLLPQSVTSTFLFPTFLTNLYQRLSVWWHINIDTIDSTFFVSFVDFELLTVVESQILRESEIQWRYNWPNFDAFSFLYWLAKSLVFAHQSCQKHIMLQN